MSRRDYLKAAGGTAGALAVGLVGGYFPHGSALELPQQLPWVPIPLLRPKIPEWIVVHTLYDGDVVYRWLWNFWVWTDEVCNPDLSICKYVPRPADQPGPFFYDYEKESWSINHLIAAVGLQPPIGEPKDAEEVWLRISKVWDFLRKNVTTDDAAYKVFREEAENGTPPYAGHPGYQWPSIEDYALYYHMNKKLVWSACFSKAHLFATLLGRVIPRWADGPLMAGAHHLWWNPETKQNEIWEHWYVGVYVLDRWFYLDPGDAAVVPLPSFYNRKSVGQIKTVDYKHPFKVVPVPGYLLSVVPLLALSAWPSP